jgi:transposase
VNNTIQNEIIHRWENGQSIRSIADSLGINRKRVTRIVHEHKSARNSGTPHPNLPLPRQRRASKLDPFQEILQQLLERYPNITAVRMQEELRRHGYDGAYTILRQRLNELRTRPRKERVIRFETPPGAQAQMDWATYEIDFSQEGRRRVNLFGYLLSYSRREYLHFTAQQDFDATIRQHICAFEHLDGVATTCLYDCFKVVVQRWDDDQPIYNSRFLAFATHYGFQPRACRPRRPQTKGKVERQFDYVEKNLLNGRTFRSLEHLNEVTRWWLANVADTRIHRKTKKRPIDAHQEELPHLLSLPQHHFDTSQVIYRVVDVEGFVRYRKNRYSVPSDWIGSLVPVRLTEDTLTVYNNHIELISQHLLLDHQQSGQDVVDPAHRPHRSHEQQVEILRERFARFGEVGSQFLEQLLSKQRYGKHQGQKILVLARSYERTDMVAALQRAIKYHAYSYSSLERILSIQAIPKAAWETLTQEQQKLLQELTDGNCITPRDSSEYQHLLFSEEENHADNAADEQKDGGQNDKIDGDQDGENDDTQK